MDDDGNEVVSNDDSLDYSSIVPVEEVVTPAASSDGSNPAWSAILDSIPEAFRDAVKPTLADWDKGVKSRFEDIHNKYKPFEQFAGVNPEDLTRSMSLKQQIDSDPLAFYRRLDEYLKTNGLLAPEVQQEDPNAEEEDPQAAAIADLRARQEEFQNLITAAQEQQQSQAIQAQADREVREELSALEAKHGQMSDYVKRELLQRAASMMDQANSAGQRIPTLEEAFNSMQGFITSVRKGKAAPKVAGSGGGLPSSQKIDPANMTDSQRRQAAIDLVSELRKQ